MSESDSWPRSIPFRNLQKSLSRLVGSIGTDPRREFRLGRQKVRIPMDGLPLRLAFGERGRKLHLYPESALSARGKVSMTGNVLLAEPGAGHGVLRREIRLTPNQVLTLGLDAQGEIHLPGLSQRVGRPQLTVKVFEDSLLLRNRQATSRIRVIPLEAASVARLVERRVGALRKLRAILEGRIEPAPEAEALELLRAVNDLLERDPHRPTDRRGMPGGLVSLPDRLSPVIVGDLRGRIDNLLAILTRGGVLDALETDRACLVILGNAAHPGGPPGAGDATGVSLMIMDLILRLKKRFPRQVFYLRGDQDTLGEEGANGEGTPSAPWRRALKQSRGKKYRKQMERFYDAIPYVAASRHFIACHGGAPTAKVTREMLINVRQYPALERELTGGRRDPGSRGRDYSRADVKRLRKSMELPAEAPFIVGHTPLAGDEALWEGVGDIAGHHRVYSAGSEWVGAVTLIDGQMVPLRYPAEPLLELYNRLPSE
jgi:hypothetical protein